MFFFTWTSGGVFSIAHAAVDAAKKRKDQEQQQKKSEGPEERFSKITEELEGTLADRKTDIGSKKSRLKAGRDEINKLDVEMHKQFVEIEKKLKDAKFSPEIMERHRKFVRHYDDNLNELKGNMARVEKAKDNTEVETELRKVNEHLQRVKAPSRHQKLDPNNLPNRQSVVKKREPRMKKEEFEQDLKKDKQAWKNQKRVQIASAGSLAGLLTSSVVTAVTPPTAADLAETVDVQLTSEIRAKALELGSNPVKIYEWVRNNIEFVPTWGSIQGAKMTLLTKQGNAFDTSSLLIALLRAAGIHAHYVTGTITLPIDKVMNWAGGFTDPMAALDFMSSGGIPTKALTEGGKVTQARMEHVWVEAFINFIPSRGAKHINGKGETWIKLDPSFKQYSYTNGIDIKSAVPFDAQAYLTQIQSTATINEAQGYVTGVNSTLTQQTMQDYQTRVQSYISQNYPNATVGDVLGKKEIVKKEYPYLLGTLPYRTAVKGTAFTEIPDTLRHKLSFSVTNGDFDESPLAITKNLAELAGKKITLSYSPATPQDEAVINSYLPKPHADGTPIQPSELPSSLPAYLINVKPELRIDGQVVATGMPVTLGGIETFDMTFFDPSADNSIVTNTITAGVYEAIGLNLGKISQDQLTNLKAKLDATKTKLQNNDFAGLSKDDLIGNLLYTTALSYHAELGTMNFIAAKTMNVNAITLPSETIFSTQLKVVSMWGVPQSVGAGGLNMDADRLLNVVKAKDGNSVTARQYMLSNGMTSSALEHSVPEQLFSTPDNLAQGVSAVKALQLANDQGIPIFTINQGNIATTLSQLQVGQDVKTDIQNAVNAGKVVTVSKTNINFNEWIGCGYIINNPDTGAGAYMISGVLNGSDTKVDKDFWSQFDTLMSILDFSNNALGKITNSGSFELCGKGLSVLGAVIQMIADINKVLDKNSTDKVKVGASMLLITSCTAITILATFLTIGAAVGGPLFVLMATALIMITITLIMNFIREIALESIWSARLKRRNRKSTEDIYV
jgi:transglutaminase-like putative cysteine protease